MTTYLPIVATTIIGGLVLGILVWFFMKEKEAKDE